VRLTALLSHVNLLVLKGFRLSSGLMDTFHQLGELLLRSLPTFFLLIFLNFYLKAMFFKPLEKVLHQRYEATEGARKIAQESLERAQAKAAEYEAALRAARAEVYQAQEQAFKKLQEHEAEQIAAARKRASETVSQAKAELRKEAEAAKASLAQQSETLANEIAESILRRRAA
jgi:F-type H+-transporting ATPase subunit b